MRKPVLIHVHIPKCGGQTFNTILKTNLEGRFACEYGLLDRGMLQDDPYTMDQVELLLKGYPDAFAFAAHRFNLALPYNTDFAHVVAITFIRDPVERLVSYYHYHHKNGHLDPVTKELTLADYSERLLQSGESSAWADFQTRFLTGPDHVNPIEAIRRLVESERLHVFPLQRFDEAMVVLEKKYPVWFRDASHVIRNTTKQDESLPTKIREAMEAARSLDRELLALASDWLDELLTAHFPKAAERDAALRDFKDRCIIKEEEAKKAESEQAGNENNAAGSGDKTKS